MTQAMDLWTVNVTNEANISSDSDSGPQIFRLLTKTVFQSKIPKVSAIKKKKNLSYLMSHRGDIISPELQLAISIWIQF